MAADAADVNMEVIEPSQARAPVSGDSGPGTALKDLLPLPSDTDPVTDPYKTETSTTLKDDPTLSHALAKDDHDVKGLAQQDHDHEVVDLGWNEKKQNIMRPLVGGMDNETLWMLIRRFDKVSASRARHGKGTTHAGRANRNVSKYTTSRQPPSNRPAASTLILPTTRSFRQTNCAHPSNGST